MKRITLFTLFISILSFQTLRADEGMWLPLLVKRLNIEDMKKMGCKLSAEEIYDINKSCLKDAIVMLSGGSCSAEVISSQGLLLTNHHCGYEAIQSNSTVDHDYLTDGFWAKSPAEELPSGGITASFLKRVEDVSKRVLDELNPQMTEAERGTKIRQIFKTIETEATSGTNYNASVKSFFNGNEFYLFVYETFRDVRLVGTPPESVGKFGGDTDNWMWPRHTGDFCLLRVYAGADNKPADYSKDNKPYKPNHFLPVSLDGVKDDDFTMIMGYPGRTDRYLTSSGVQMALDISNPHIVKIREKKLNLMKEDMDASKEVRLKYASTYAQTANYWKYFIGQTQQLKNNQVVQKKKELEQKFTSWVNANPQRKEKYGNALSEIENAYLELRKIVLNRVYLNEAILRGPAIIGFSLQFDDKKTMLSDSSQKSAFREMQAELKELGSNFYKDYNLGTEKKLMLAMLRMYVEGVNKFKPTIYDTINIKYGGNYNAFVDDLYSRSVFGSLEQYNRFIEDPFKKKLTEDPAMNLASMFLNNYVSNLKPQVSELEMRIDKGNRLFVAGLREMMPDKKFYPNANSTMRLTYGKVKSYVPRDAVYYSEFTTLKGVIEKEDPANPEFVVPARLKELYKKKDFGPYGNGESLNTCFISTTDITGGNSGSPVINGKGHLIGCAFDGNWEAMSGDIFFETNVQRTISVDIRYVLFLIDKLAGAGHIVDEMKLIRKGKEVKRNG